MPYSLDFKSYCVKDHLLWLLVLYFWSRVATKVRGGHVLWGQWFQVCPKTWLFLLTLGQLCPQKVAFLPSVSLAFFVNITGQIDHLARFFPKTGCYCAVGTGFVLLNCVH